MHGRFATDEWTGPDGPRTTLVMEADALGPDLTFGSSHFALPLESGRGLGRLRTLEAVMGLEESSNKLLQPLEILGLRAFCRLKQCQSTAASVHNADDVRQPADPVNLDIDAVPRPEENRRLTSHSNTLRRAGQDGEGPGRLFRTHGGLR